MLISLYRVQLIDWLELVAKCHIKAKIVVLSGRQLGPRVQTGIARERNAFRNL